MFEAVSLFPFSVSELEATVDKLQKEVEQLREQRNQQKQLADSNARQRDMYKALLTQSTGFSLPPAGGNPDTYGPFVVFYLFIFEQSVERCLQNDKILCVSAGPDSSSHSAPVRPSVPATRSTPQRAAAAESAQTAQSKAALKQVRINICFEQILIQ